MFKWKLTVDYHFDKNFDLLTWTYNNMIIQKFRSDNEYAIWMKINNTGNIIKDYKYYGTKRKFKQARKLAEDIYIEEL